jgi:DNA end-binding protein Ku
MWKGTLRVGKHQVAVKLYAAVTDRTVHFHLLHAKDKVRVEQRMIHPNTGEPVDKEEIQKAYEIEPGTFVVLTPEELETLQPEPARDIDVHTFVPAEAILPAWYERPYYLGPDGSTEAYFALAKALRDEERVGIANWVMRGREYHGALRAEGDHLALVTLRALEEVIQPPKVDATVTTTDAREVAMAEQLVEALAGDFDPETFKDEHGDRLRALIEAKAGGKRIKKAKIATKRTEGSLHAALAASLKHVGHPGKERRSA